MTGHPENDDPDTPNEGRAATGPRGGESTISPGGDMVCKNFGIDTELEARLRKEAFDQRISEAESIRRLLPHHDGVD